MNKPSPDLKWLSMVKIECKIFAKTRVIILVSHGFFMRVVWGRIIEHLYFRLKAVSHILLDSAI